MNNAAINTLVHIIGDNRYAFLLGLCLGDEISGNSQCSALEDTAKEFPK